jgi:hypothetical protein
VARTAVPERERGFGPSPPVALGLVTHASSDTIRTVTAVDRDCLTVMAIDCTVTVTRLSTDVELGHRVGDLISDGAGGHWRVEEIVCEERCLVVSEIEIEIEQPRIAVPELLAA